MEKAKRKGRCVKDLSVSLKIFTAGFFCLLFYAFPVFAQTTLRGRVVDFAGAPVAGIRVSVLPTKVQGEHELGILTDEEGVFGVVCDLDKEKGRILVLDGEKGQGRVRLDAEVSQFFEVVYPVRTKVVFLHDNDIHFNYSHIEALKEKVSSLRDGLDNVFLLSAGDVFVWRPEKWRPAGCLDFYERQGRLAVEKMNQLGYDAMVLGNHELYVHTDETGKNVTAYNLSLAEFPFLCANAKLDAEDWYFIRPYTQLKTDNGLRINIIGLSEGNNTFSFFESVARYRQLAGNSEIFVALTHLGLPFDRLLAKAMPELDVIVGGHSHTLLEEAEMVNGVLIAQAGPVSESIRCLGKITIILENGIITEKKGKVFLFRQ